MGSNKKGQTLCYGFGINDIGTDAKWYNTWKGVLERCFSEIWINKHLTYRGTTVCQEWLTASNFSDWCENNGGIPGELQLDKDILFPGNKHYSPETCVFITPALNSLLLLNKKTRSEYGIGVTKTYNRFQARIKINDETIRIGRFDTTREASKAYLDKKCEVIKSVSDTHKDERVSKALLKHIELLIESWEKGTI